MCYNLQRAFSFTILINRPYTSLLTNPIRLLVRPKNSLEWLHGHVDPIIKSAPTVPLPYSLCIIVKQWLSFVIKIQQRSV